MKPFVIKSLICVSALAFYSHAQAELVDKSTTMVKTEADMLAYYAQTFATRGASWKKTPNLKVPYSVTTRHNSGDTFKLSARLDVAKDGSITNVSIVQSSGDQRLDTAALAAFKNAKLNPFIIDGRPVPGRITIPVVYKIQ
ncbi:energy transducer TonB [Psychrobacter lutiphocae]|uniref:energy transducer TonB n=1 Tax=Psychrobacter lutiphocae TaxID=540500 RepID=UPI00037F7E3C|nr:energy transducer TonB [Psychrobacter lutiphocae]